MGRRMMQDMIDDDVWTPRRVGDCLVEAIKWANLAAGPTGPADVRSNMPALLMLADERETEQWPQIKELEPEPMRRQFSPARVSQFERVIQWPMRYLADFKEREPGAYRVFLVWLHCKLWRGMKFEAECDRRGWSRANAYRWRDKTLSTIALGLTADGIKRGQH